MLVFRKKNFLEIGQIYQNNVDYLGLIKNYSPEIYFRKTQETIDFLMSLEHAGHNRLLHKRLSSFFLRLFGCVRR